MKRRIDDGRLSGFDLNKNKAVQMFVNVRFVKRRSYRVGSDEVKHAATETRSKSQKVEETIARLGIHQLHSGVGA